MSYSVNIITKKHLDPKIILHQVAQKGQKIVVTNDSFPSIKFGVYHEGLRGIEVNEEENGYEVRICDCSSRADHRLFPVAIDVLKEITGDIAFTEDEEPIDNPYVLFDDLWIEKEIKKSWDVICTLVRHSGATLTLYGMFLPYCVGPRLLLKNGISIYPPYDDNKKGYDWLIEYFTIIQWSLANGTDTSSRLAMPIRNNPDMNPMGISLISIKDSQVSDFDYVSEAPLLGICDLDNNETVLIRFNDFRRSIETTDMFIDTLAGIDECQMRVCGSKKFTDKEHAPCGGRVDINEIKNIMETAKRYVPEDVTYRPTYPGSGYDEKQNTFVLMWNPDNSGQSLDDYISSMKKFYIGPFSRRVHEWKTARMDDRFYVIKVGEGKTGVVMAGVFSSQPYLQSNPSGKGGKQHYMELRPSMMVNPNTVPLLTTETIENAIPNFMWRGGYSGRMLSDGQARTIEKLFADYQKTLENMDDGINICLIKRF